jgi:hypothetical protein
LHSSQNISPDLQTTGDIVPYHDERPDSPMQVDFLNPSCNISGLNLRQTKVKAKCEVHNLGEMVEILPPE